LAHRRAAPHRDAGGASSPCLEKPAARWAAPPNRAIRSRIEHHQLVSYPLVTTASRRAVEIDGPDGPIRCLVWVPTEGSRRDRPALLISYDSTTELSSHAPPHNITTRAFVARGHRALAWDMPHHGTRIARGSPAGLCGMALAIADGRDPYTTVCRETAGSSTLRSARVGWIRPRAEACSPVEVHAVVMRPCG
jgi:hypothetical protein